MKDRILWWILGIIATVILAISSAVYAELNNRGVRIYQLEVRSAMSEQRLERIESKIDKILERGK